MIIRTNTSPVSEEKKTEEIFLRRRLEEYQARERNLQDHITKLENKVAI